MKREVLEAVSTAIVVAICVAFASFLLQRGDEIAALAVCFAGPAAIAIVSCGDK